MVDQRQEVRFRIERYLAAAGPARSFARLEIGASMLRVGFVGLGAISHEHVLGYLTNPDAEIVAVCCPDECASRLWLEKWKLPFATYYNSLEPMLENEHLDLVEILTPTYLHAPQAIACARAKVKGISLQKPM